MTYKTILVHVGVDPETPARLQAAVAVATQFGATVVGVGAQAWDPYVDPTLGYCDGETIQALRNLVDEDLAAAETAFKAATKDYQGQTAWRSLVDFPADAMNALACNADLIVASRGQRGFDYRRCPSPADLVMGAGLPVLLVPADGKVAAAGNVLIGWKNTRETRRAVTDALPFLQAAEKVYLVQVAENDAVGSARSDLDAVVERLTRHGVFAEASSTPQLAPTVVEDLMNVADSRNCDLVVLGAYGHSRLKELAFGGVTDDVLISAPRPILFSH